METNNKDSKHSNRHKYASPKGGVAMRDEDDAIKTATSMILKKVGQKLIEGSFFDLMKISRPAIVTYPMSMLQAMARDYRWCTRFLEKAALIPDPIEKIKYVVAFCIAGLYTNPTEFGAKSPLNPVLGETFQAVMPDGETKIYLEQTSHHPPVSHYLLEGKGYRVHGHGEVVAGLNGINTLKGLRIGKNVVKFDDGAVYSFQEPEMRITGLVYGDRVLNYVSSLVVKDYNNKMEATVTFNSQGKEGKLGKLAKSLGGLFKKKEVDKELSDFFTVSIYQVSNNNLERVEIAKGGGSWLEYLEIDGERMWEMGQESDMFKRSDDILPSDSSLRADLVALIHRDLGQSQRAKEEIEELQRNDAKLRKEYKDKTGKK